VMEGLVDTEFPRNLEFSVLYSVLFGPSVVQSFSHCGFYLLLWLPFPTKAFPNAKIL
jgi:hypothetical protein